MLCKSCYLRITNFRDTVKHSIVGALVSISRNSEQRYIFSTEDDVLHMQFFLTSTIFPETMLALSACPWLSGAHFTKRAEVYNPNIVRVTLKRHVMIKKFPNVHIPRQMSLRKW